VTTLLREDIQPEPVPSHLLVRIVQLTPALQMSAMSYDWLKELLDKNPKAVPHIVIPTGERPGDRRIVLTAGTAELQRLLLAHLKTEAAWTSNEELRREPAAPPAQ
jgi:hypothetical protein